MGSLMKKQAERFLREKKRHRRWLALFLCLALLVTSGTFAALRMNGQAMDHGGKELDCKLRIHTHAEECFDQKAELVCGKADYVIHTHNGKCYDENGNLACQLPEREAHVHDSNCYTEEQVLICREEESAGHQHSEQCYIEEKGDLLCAVPEHEHGEGCYDEEGNLLCGQEAHMHDDNCFAVNQVLICTQEEGSGSHTHTESCYETKKTLTCEKEELELHRHDEIACYDENGNLTCGKLELEEHEHGAGCFIDVKEEEEELLGDEIEESVSKDETSSDANASEEKDSDNDTGKDDTVKEEPSEEPAPDDEKSEDNVSDNSVSGNTVSGGNVSDNSVSGNTVSGGNVSGNTLSGNTVSGDSLSENSVSGNGVSGNSISENTISLSANVGGTIITLSGPESSFETDKELSIQAEKVKDDEQIEAIEKAVDKLAEKKDKEVKDYQAFDIKLLADDEEVQPLGPVEVKFSGKKVEKAVENEKTDVEVLHVDDETGKSQDMKASATEEKEVVIETEHFSVYVYVNLEDIFGKINVTVQHWGDGIKVLKGEAKASAGTDTILKNASENKKNAVATIQTEEKNCELYSADTLEIPNEYYSDIEKLSKVCEVKPESAKAYIVSKIWISQGNTNSAKEETWAAGSYAEYTNNNGNWTLTKAPNSSSSSSNQAEPTKITLKNNSIIRFWYKPKEKQPNKEYDVTFYDYDITNGQTQTVDGKTCYLSDRQGINSDSNYATKTESNRLGVGQWSAGNFSSWVKTNEGATLTGGLGTPYLNQRPVPGPILEGIVQKELAGGAEGTLQFSSNVTAPKNLFSTPAGTKGTTVHSDYQLSFQRYGDTFVLDKVYKGETEVESNLSKMTYMQSAWARPPAVGAPMYSNNFWPMDAEQGKDPHAGKGKTINFTNGTDVTTPVDNDDQLNYSSEENAHNWYFGMRFSVKFKVGDYTGPMEYYFRGDDDFWLFIDGKLAVDIGGIHQVAGESINLRKWMEDNHKLGTDENGNPIDKNKEHTMDIFYMERGAWGSCCYIQFILPNTEVVDIPDMKTTEYSITKNWDDGDSPYRPESIKVRLVQEWGEAEDKETKPTEEYQILSEENNWTYHWEGLPLINGSTEGQYNYSYKVEEVNLPPGYTPVLVNGKLTNQLKPVKVEVEKKWQNDEGLENYRPKSITLQLYANGEVYKDKEGNTKTVTLTADNGWKGVFDNLPEYCNYRLIDDGNTYDADKVEYSVREVSTGTAISDNGYLTTEDGVQYKVTYEREDYNLEDTPTSSPEASAPQQDESETIEKDEVDSEDSELIEPDEEDSKNEEAGDMGSAEEDSALEDTAYGDAAEDVNIEEMNAQAAYSVQDSAPAAETNSDDSEQKTVSKLTVTNTLDKNFKVVKKDSNSTSENAIPLSGAEFKLTPCNDSGIPTQGSDSETIISGEGGTLNLEWETLEVGYYLMEETKAPAGYMLSRTKWIIQIVEKFSTKEIGEVKSFEDYSADYPDVPNSESVSENFVDSAVNPDGLVLTYTFYNDEIYELPSTGGMGIYWYTISGMLLMLGASLILYKNKYGKSVKGVFGK